MKKIIAPVFIVLLAIAFIILYAVGILFAPIPVLWKLLIGIGVLALIGGLIAVLIERIKEIEEEDEDDLGKY